MAQRLPERSQDETAAQPSANRISSKLEIPVMLTKREEIKLQRTGYTVSYNNFYKTPNWVAWELTRQETKGSEERKNRFVPDPDLPEPRVEHANYTRSRIRPGTHGSGSRHEMEQESMEESFYMSNICPQNQKLNRDDWEIWKNYAVAGPGNMARYTLPADLSMTRNNPSASESIRWPCPTVSSRWC